MKMMINVHKIIINVHKILWLISLIYFLIKFKIIDTTVFLEETQLPPEKLDTEAQKNLSKPSSFKEEIGPVIVGVIFVLGALAFWWWLHSNNDNGGGAMVGPGDGGPSNAREVRLVTGSSDAPTERELAALQELAQFRMQERLINSELDALNAQYPPVESSPASASIPTLGPRTLIPLSPSAVPVTSHQSTSPEIATALDALREAVRNANETPTK